MMLDTQAQSEIQTVFNSPLKNNGGYGAITNSFTRINGEFANMVGVYGGWYINHKLMLGVGAAATTSYLPVLDQFNAYNGKNASYEYGQVGFMTEYVLASSKAIHVNFNMLTGAGFTVQYQRNAWNEDFNIDNHQAHDENWFFVVEPGVQVEINLLRWLRFSPGMSYRFVNNSNAPGLKDSDLQGASLNMTLKFGKF